MGALIKINYDIGKITENFRSLGKLVEYVLGGVEQMQGVASLVRLTELFETRESRSVTTMMCTNNIVKTVIIIIINLPPGRHGGDWVLQLLASGAMFRTSFLLVTTTTQAILHSTFIIRRPKYSIRR